MSKPIFTNWFTKTCVTAFVYFIVAQLSLYLAIPPGNAIAVWPAAAFAFICVLKFGYGVWPGIVVGSILARYSHIIDPKSSVTILHSGWLIVCLGLGAALQACLGNYLVRKIIKYPNTLLFEKDLIWFFALAGPISCLTGSIFGVIDLYMRHRVAFDRILLSWGTSWIGDTLGVLVFAPILLILVGEPRAQWKQKRATLLPICLMITMVLFLFVNVKKWEQRQIQLDFIRKTDQLDQTLTKNFQRYLEVVYTLRAFFNSSDDVSRTDFRSFTKPLLERHPGVRILSWSPFVKEKDVPKLIKTAKKNGFNDFQIKVLDANGELVPTNAGGDHVAVLFLEPLNMNKNVIGFDVSAIADRREAIVRARDTGDMAATSRLTLVSVAGNKQGFGVFLPVYKTSVVPTSLEGKQNELLGYVTGGFEIENMMLDALKNVELDKIRLRIVDNSGDESKKIIYNSHLNNQTPNQKDIQFRKIPFDMGGRKWEIEFYVSAEDFFGNQPWIAWSVLAGGLLFMSLLSMFLLSVAGGNAKSHELIELRTAELRESRERFELAVAGSTDGIFDWNLVIDEVYFSPRYKEMLGYHGAEFEDSASFALGLIHPEDLESLEKRIKDHFEKHVPYQVEFRMKKKTGEFIWILARGQALWDETGKALRFVGSHSDISERKEVDRIKTQFFDMVSHELRTPLTPIHQFTTILQDGIGGPINDRQKEYLEIILKNTLQLQKIIEDVVDASRISNNKLSVNKEPMVVDLFSEKIIQSFSHTAKTKDIILINRVDPELPCVWADPIRIEQVLRNLIDNALKFTPAKGSIEVSTHYPWKNEDMICFSVLDTGIGIPGKDKNKVFERLYQVFDKQHSSRKGLGLGLHICKEIVEQHGGRIWVESEEGKGSTFYFTLQVFSFEKMLSPLLKKTGEIPKDLGLISINVLFPQLITESERRQSIRELEIYLQYSILAHDVLITGRAFSDHKAEFYLVIAANETGVKIVVDRLGSQFVLKNKFAIKKLDLRFEYRMIQLPSKEQVQNIPDLEQLKMISSSLRLMIHNRA